MLSAAAVLFGAFDRDIDKVLPLALSGRPADFGGGVGAGEVSSGKATTFFRLAAAAAAPAAVSAGDLGTAIGGGPRALLSSSPAGTALMSSTSSTKEGGFGR